MLHVLLSILGIRSKRSRVQAHEGPHHVHPDSPDECEVDRVREHVETAFHAPPERRTIGEQRKDLLEHSVCNLPLNRFCAQPIVALQHVWGQATDGLTRSRKDRYIQKFAQCWAKVRITASVAVKGWARACGLVEAHQVAIICNTAARGGQPPLLWTMLFLKPLFLVRHRT